MSNEWTILTKTHICKSPIKCVILVSSVNPQKLNPYWKIKYGNCGAETSVECYNVKGKSCLYCRCLVLCSLYSDGWYCWIIWWISSYDVKHYFTYEFTFLFTLITLISSYFYFFQREVLARGLFCGTQTFIAINMIKNTFSMVLHRGLLKICKN